MLIDEVSKQVEQIIQFLHFLEKYGKMPRDVRDRMHDGCNLVNNLNHTHNYKFQTPICQVWCYLPRHYIVINTLLISPKLCPKGMSCFTL